jgi:hypothetical protein
MEAGNQSICPYSFVARQRQNRSCFRGGPQMRKSLSKEPHHLQTQADQDAQDTTPAKPSARLKRFVRQRLMRILMDAGMLGKQDSSLFEKP